MVIKKFNILGPIVHIAQQFEKQHSIEDFSKPYLADDWKETESLCLEFLTHNPTHFWEGNTWTGKYCQSKSKLSLPGSASGKLQGNRDVLWRRKTWKISYHWEKNPSKEGFKMILREWMWEVILQGNTAPVCSSHHCLRTQYFSRLMGWEIYKIILPCYSKA